MIWACNICKKKQELLAKTGTWYHGGDNLDTLSDASTIKSDSTPTNENRLPPSDVNHDGQGSDTGGARMGSKYSKELKRQYSLTDARVKGEQQQLDEASGGERWGGRPEQYHSTQQLDELGGGGDRRGGARPEQYQQQPPPTGDPRDYDLRLPTGSDPRGRSREVRHHPPRDVSPGSSRGGRVVDDRGRPLSPGSSRGGRPVDERGRPMSPGSRGRPMSPGSGRGGRPMDERGRPGRSSSQDRYGGRRDDSRHR